MVESAPLFIEYCCEGYMNIAAFKAVVAVLLICCVASWLCGFFCLRIFKKAISN